MRLIIWKLDKELAQLEEEINLTSAEFSYYNSISSKKRRLEWLTSRLMVRREIGENVSTVYVNRRPCLVGSDLHISISHSDNHIVLMISDTQCGVDIEDSTRDFSRVSKRFLCSEELSWMSADDVALAWCIKEAAYKMIGVLDIDFATMFHIKKIDHQSGLSILTYKDIDYHLSIKSFDIYNIVFGSLNIN